jgi:hypothetical protein
MKQIMFVITLLVVLYLSTGFCHAFEKGDEGLLSAASQLELREIRFKAERMEAEADFHRQMQELELEERRIELDHQRKELEGSGDRRHHGKKCAGPLLLICLIVHILATVWVYQDVRKRKAGSGIWIVITLLAGLLGMLVYAVVRLGDTEKT